MKAFYSAILGAMGREGLREAIAALWNRERPQTFKAYAASSAYAHGLLTRAGLEQAEILPFPADGRTVYQDKRTPLAWDADRGRLTVLSPAGAFPDPVLADTHRHPFHLIKGSTATPPGGLKVRIITERRMREGRSAAGTLVLAEPDSAPRPETLSAALDQGGLGLITDFLRNTRDETPDALYWANAFTETPGWHVQSGDRAFIAYCVSPRTGDRLRAEADRGEVVALAESDGRRYSGVLPGVTALLPGRRKEELWLMAHLYEPLADDNSSGVACAVEIARLLKELSASGKLPPLEFSIRVVLASEMYGFAAFADHFGGTLRGRCIGALNLDSLPSGNPGERFQPQLAPAGTPFFGNSLLEEWAGLYRGVPPVDALREAGGYSDDTFLSDPTVGLPTAWVRSFGKKFWHHSELTMDRLNMDTLCGVAAFAATWVASVATLSEPSLPAAVERAGRLAAGHLDREAQRIRAAGEQERCPSGGMRGETIHKRMAWRLRVERERLADFRRVGKVSGLEDLLAALERQAEALTRDLLAAAPASQAPAESPDGPGAAIYARCGIGLPYDLVKAPRARRRRLPDVYRVLANLDGRKSLSQAIREAEWEENVLFDEQHVRAITESAALLAEFGYLERQGRPSHGDAG